LRALLLEWNLAKELLESKKKEAGAKLLEQVDTEIQDAPEPEETNYQPFIEQSQVAVTEEAEVGDAGQSDQLLRWMWEPHPEDDLVVDQDEETVQSGSEADEGGEEDTAHTKDIFDRSDRIARPAHGCSVSRVVSNQRMRASRLYH
jgi:hypothetical protein